MGVPKFKRCPCCNARLLYLQGYCHCCLAGKAEFKRKQLNDLKSKYAKPEEP